MHTIRAPPPTPRSVKCAQPMRPHHPAPRQNSPSPGPPSPRLTVKMSCDPRPPPPPSAVKCEMDENADACSTNLLNAAAPASVAHADPKCVHRPHRSNPPQQTVSGRSFLLAAHAPCRSPPVSPRSSPRSDLVSPHPASHSSAQPHAAQNLPSSRRRARPASRSQPAQAGHGGDAGAPPFGLCASHRAPPAPP